MSRPAAAERKLMDQRRALRDRYLGEANAPGLHPARRARLVYLAMLICEHTFTTKDMCIDCGGTAEAIKAQDDHVHALAALIAMNADASRTVKT